MSPAQMPQCTKEHYKVLQQYSHVFFMSLLGTIVFGVLGRMLQPYLLNIVPYVISLGLAVLNFRIIESFHISSSTNDKTVSRAYEAAVGITVYLLVITINGFSFIYLYQCLFDIFLAP